MSVCDRDGHEWIAHWQAMTDDELLDERFRLYDLAEDLEPGSAVYEFARGALNAIGRLERHRTFRRTFQAIARVGLPDLDAELFADALIEINRFRLLLGEELDAATTAEVFRGAIEVAERRAQAVGDANDQTKAW
jgi:hypothetical protein